MEHAPQSRASDRKSWNIVAIERHSAAYGEHGVIQNPRRCFYPRVPLKPGMLLSGATASASIARRHRHWNIYPNFEVLQIQDRFTRLVNIYNLGPRCLASISSNALILDTFFTSACEFQRPIASAPRTKFSGSRATMQLRGGEKYGIITPPALAQSWDISCSSPMDYLHHMGR